VFYPLHVHAPAERSVTRRLVARLTLGSALFAFAVVAITFAIGITGARLSASHAARSDIPLGVESASDGVRYRLLGSVVANQQALTNDLPAEIEATHDDEDQPSILSQAPFSAGAFESEQRSFADPDTVMPPALFDFPAPDYSRISRFEPDHFQQAVALADQTPLPRRRPKLAALTPVDGLGVEPEENLAKTAIYDITAQVVYMPNGDRLEAHSGLGRKMDDPKHVHIRMHGATPPNTYKLTLREKLFHGVQEISLNPIGEGNMLGRAGILAHTYMRAERPVERLRLVQGLREIPCRLPARRGRAHGGGVAACPAASLCARQGPGEQVRKPDAIVRGRIAARCGESSIRQARNSLSSAPKIA